MAELLQSSGQVQSLQPFSFTYLNPGTLKSFLRWILACGVCSPGTVWVQIGVFLCSARNNLLCDTLQGLGFVAACVQVGCFKVLHQRKFFSADSMDKRKVNFSVVFLHHGMDFYLRRIGSLCEKAFAQCSVLRGAANTKTRWKMIKLSIYQGHI